MALAPVLEQVRGTTARGVRCSAPQRPTPAATRGSAGNPALGRRRLRHPRHGFHGGLMRDRRQPGFRLRYWPPAASRLPDRGTSIWLDASDKGLHVLQLSQIREPCRLSSARSRFARRYSARLAPRVIGRAPPQKVSVLAALSDPEHLGPAVRAHPLSRWPTIFHGNGLGAPHLPGLSTLNAIAGHLSSS